MATAAASAGTVELVDAALAPYEHADLRWLVRRHVFAILQEFPTLLPSVDSYTTDDGKSAVLLNVRGRLTVAAAVPSFRVTIWLPREYPFRRPLVYALPATARAVLVPDHPFVDHRTGRVRNALPYLDGWRVPESSLAGLLRSLVGAFRMCHPLATVAVVDNFVTGTSPEEECHRLHKVLADELTTRLGTYMAGFRDHIDLDIQNLSSLQACLGARSKASDHAICKLEKERLMLERAVTGSHGYRGQLITWLHKTCPLGEAEIVLEPQMADGGDGKRWLEIKASELALDDVMDALGQALENGELEFSEYIKRVKVLAREQFFHCYAASASLNNSSSRLQLPHR